MTQIAKHDDMHTLVQHNLASVAHHRLQGLFVNLMIYSPRRHLYPHIIAELEDAHLRDDIMLRCHNV
jgi:hypothetical protein